MNKSRVPGIGTTQPPRETVELRRELEQFLSQSLGDFVTNPPLGVSNRPISVGGVKWGVYAFFDYDGEPIYVGQTRESLGTRIRRHLTNQRTDAVAMSVLDPFEVKTIRVWPLPQFQDAKGKPTQSVLAREAADLLNSLEFTVFHKLVQESRFKRILNEKDPPNVDTCGLELEISGDIVSPDVLKDREHPDLRFDLAALSTMVRAPGRSSGVAFPRCERTQRGPSETQRTTFCGSVRFKHSAGIFSPARATASRPMA